MTAKQRQSWWKRLWIPLTLLFLLLMGGGVAIYLQKQPDYRVNYQKGKLHMRSGRPGKALASFRRALDQNPDYLEARLGMVQAFIQAKNHKKATKTVTEAEEAGLEPWRAASLQAKIYLDRATHRIQQQGDALDRETCTTAIKNDVQPAIDLLKKHVGESPEPAPMLTQLGDAYMRKSGLLGQKRRLVQEEARLARNAGNQERKDTLSRQAAEILPQMGQAQRNAMERYREAIDADPDAAKPRLAAARHLLSIYVPRPTEARDLLQPIIEDAPSHRDARILLAQATRAQDNYEQALAHLAEIGSEDEKDGDGDARPEPAVARLKAQILADDGQWDKARALAQSLLAREQDDMRARFVLGRALYHLGSYEEATTQLQYIFSRIDQPWPQARLALAKALRKAGSPQQAITAYQKATAGVDEKRAATARVLAELRRVKYEANLALATLLTEDLPEMALQHARTAFEIRPGRAEAYEALMAALGVQDETEADRAEAAATHASALADEGKLNRALSVCQSALEEASETSNRRQLRLLKSRILASKGSYDRAITAYRQLWQDSGDPGPGHELATLHLELGHLEKAQKIYQKLHEADRNDQRALLGLVRVALARGNTDRAFSIVEQSRAETDSQATTALLMKLYARYGQFENASKLADSLVESNPKDASLRVASARLHWAAGNRKKARTAFQQALEIDPDHLPAYGRGLLDLAQERYDAAIGLFQEARERFPRHPAPLLHLAVAYQAKGQPEKAIQTLQKSLQEDSPLPEQRRGGLHWDLALMYAGQGDVENALQHNRGVNSRDFGLRGERASFLEKLASSEEETRTQAATVLCLANAFNRGQNRRPALRRARRAEELLPDSPLVTTWKLGLHEKLGQQDRAISGLQKVIDEYPELLTPRIRLADAYAGGDDLQKAVETLRETLSYADESSSGVLHLHIARLHERMEEYDKALESYRAAVRAGTESFEAYNNMAYILATQKDNPSAALPLAEKAVELAGPRPRILDTLGWTYCLNGNHDEAIKHLERARDGLPQVPDIRYHLGVAYQRSGNAEKAAEELRQALSISSTFPHAEDARDMLNDISR